MIVLWILLIIIGILWLGTGIVAGIILCKDYKKYQRVKTLKEIGLLIVIFLICVLQGPICLRWVLKFILNYDI
jgi:hypothetical protein